MRPLGSSTECDEGPGWQSKAELEPSASVHSCWAFLCSIVCIYKKETIPIGMIMGNKEASLAGKVPIIVTHMQQLLNKQ